uniref:Trafficking protein particle complex subunit 2 putat n=1 Tax=Albugo laibachii Nc14 TaxID=890382 RepID=F0WMS2_9STRA|nr:trafficking protein particle complex subunit 2 putat [Albugo laibachii Nc14]|eukprot:CCA22607.1 trafficking protein particle complex subunit 2 putat [Albugo laibachii Nc14]
MSVLMLVGSKVPLYKVEFKNRKEENAHVNEFLIHSALDVVDEMTWTTSAMALKVVDTFNDQYVSAFVTATNLKFLLLHDSRNDDAIKSFFTELYELYLKLLMNPFYEYDTKIASQVFDARVKTLARRYLY